MSAHKILKEGSLNKVRSGGWGTNKRWFVLFREVGSSTHSLVYFKNEAARKANFSQPAGVYAVKLIKAVRARDKDDPKNVGVSIYFKSTTPASPSSPSSPASPSKNSEETKEEKEAEPAVVASKEADKPSEDKPTEPAADSAEKPAENSAEKPAEKSPEKAAEKSPEKEKPSKEAGGHAEKTFMLLEAENKAEADAWLAALVKAHSEEGAIPQQVLLQEETEKLRENRAKKEKEAEGAAKIEGELRKLKQSNKLGIGAWQTRFFSLDAEFFSYYKSSKKGEPLGYFPVTQMVCVGTSPLQENTCFFFRLPATFSTGDGKYLKTGAPPMSPSGAASDGEEDKKSDKAADGKAKDVIILLRCNTTAERDRWIQSFVDLGVKKAVSKDKPEAKPDSKPDEQGDAKSEAKAESKPEASPEAKPETSPEAKPEASSETKPDASTDSSSSSSSSSPAPLPVEGD